MKRPWTTKGPGLTLGPLLYHVLSLGLLFGRTPPPILVVPVGAGFTSGLAGSGRVLALPALCWPARRDFLGEGDGLLQLTGFLSFGAPLDAVDLVRGPVLFGALVTSCLPFDGRLAAVSAEAEGLGLDEMLLLIEPFSFSSGLRCQRGSFLCGILRRGYFVGSLPFGVIGMCLLGTAFMLSGWDWDRKVSTKSCLLGWFTPLLPVQRTRRHNFGDSGLRGWVQVAH